MSKKKAKRSRSNGITITRDDLENLMVFMSESSNCSEVIANAEAHLAQHPEWKRTVDQDHYNQIRDNAIIAHTVIKLLHTIPHVKLLREAVKTYSDLNGGE